MTLSNPYFIIILASTVLLFHLDLVASFLNMSRLRPEVPKEFADVFDKEAYAKSQDYTRESARFGLVEASAMLAVFLLFWLIGGFGLLDAWVRGLGQGPVVSGLIYIAVLHLGSTLIALPFEIYDTFVIEEKFGFNRTTPATFIVDHIKGLLLGAVIGLPLLALILWLFETYPNAWLYAWVSVSVFMLAMFYIAPRWIMPLFNKFKPLETGELRTSVERMSAECGFPGVEVYVMDGSKRSAKSNAFFSGIGKTKLIALFDTLIEKHTVPELTAVLAHEIGHYKRGHIVRMLILQFLQTALIFFLIGLFLHNRQLFDAFGVPQTSVYLSLIFFFILFTPISRITGVITSVFSRKHEFEADAYAAQAMRTGEPLATALKKLSVTNLSNLTPHPFYVFLNYSHPPVIERLNALKLARS